MTQDQIDRLAAFCKLADKGYTRDPDGYWVQDRLGLDRFAWRPDQSDDDCRVVLEEFYRVADLTQRKRFWDELADMSLDHPSTTWAEYLIVGPPAEKCAAVLKVLGDA